MFTSYAPFQSSSTSLFQGISGNQSVFPQPTVHHDPFSSTFSQPPNIPSSNDNVFGTSVFTSTTARNTFGTSVFGQPSFSTSTDNGSSVFERPTQSVFGGYPFYQTANHNKKPRLKTTRK